MMTAEATSEMAAQPKKSDFEKRNGKRVSGENSKRMLDL